MGSHQRDYSYRSTISYSVPSGQNVHIIGSNGTPIVSISNTVRTPRSDPRHDRRYDTVHGSSSSISSPQMMYYTTGSGSHHGYDSHHQGHAVPQRPRDRNYEDRRPERRESRTGDKYVYNEPDELNIPRRSTQHGARSDRRHADPDHRKAYVLTKKEIDERNERIQRHKSDIQSYIQDAEKDTSGYKWGLEIGFWKSLLQNYDVLAVDDPNFKKKVDEYRGRVFFSLKEGIDKRNEKLKENPSKNDPSGVIFSRLSRLADEKIDEYDREVNKFKKNISA
ncbi:hypothetical protein ACEPAG_2395 [Sanghuangporus baumii]